jgi:hypothetical protein
MKRASAIDLDDVLSKTAADAAAKPVTNYVTVYTFYVYDHDQGKTVVYPRMATPAAIARMRGKMNEGTAWVVDAATLDVEGFYSGTVSG